MKLTNQTRVLKLINKDTIWQDLGLMLDNIDFFVFYVDMEERLKIIGNIRFYKNENINVFSVCHEHFVEIPLEEFKLEAL